MKDGFMDMIQRQSSIIMLEENPFISMSEEGQTGSFGYQEHVDHVFDINRIIHHGFFPQGQAINQLFHKGILQCLQDCQAQTSKKMIAPHIRTTKSPS